MRQPIRGCDDGPVRQPHQINADFKKSTTAVARIFLKHWVANYGTPFKLPTENGPQFVSKFFSAVFSTLGRNIFTITEYQQQTNGQEKLLNSTLILRERHKVFKYQTDWNTCLLPLQYSYNVQNHRTIEASPFILVLRRTSP